MSEIESIHSTDGLSHSTTELGVSEATLDLAERVALRLNVFDKPAIFNLGNPGCAVAHADQNLMTHYFLHLP